MASKDIVVRRGVKTLAYVVVAGIVVLILADILLPIVATVAFVAFIAWLILRALRK